MINPVKLESYIVDIIDKRIIDEYKAYFFYIKASNWCKDKGYNNAYNFFLKESNNELKHSLRLQNFLTDWNVIPISPKLNDIDFSFNSLPDIIEKAYNLEYNLLLSYEANVISVMAKSPRTFNFLQWFVDIQNESVIEYADLINGLELINLNNPLDILYFENKYFK